MNVGEIQRELSHKAERSAKHRFHDLYRYLYNLEWLKLAHAYVAQNAGSITAGCDGINIKLFDENLEANLVKLAEELKSERFEPQPVRRVYIPKSQGKYRPLGIASIRDRIVQEALRMILEPIYEADFSPYSFGFRPNRCTMDAIKCITWSAQENKRYFWIIEGDISSYFDSIHHRKLVQILRHRIADEKLIRLIWKFLRAGVMEGKLFRDTKRGTPQGGIASPILANIYLHELDKYMERYTGLSRKEKTARRQQGLANYVYVRYADDWAVLCNGTREQAEALKEELCQFLKIKLRLQLSKEKTKITHLNDGFIFLGFRVQRKPGSKGIQVHVQIPTEAIEKLKEKIAAATVPKTHQDSVNSTILALNQILSGWCHYYGYTSEASTVFHQIGRYSFWKMAHWLGRKFRIAMPEVMRRFRKENTFATEQYQMIYPAGIRTQVYKRRFLKPNPYTIQEINFCREELPTETYWTGYEARPGMADLRPIIMQRDGYVCRLCGTAISNHTAEVDHIRPVRRFKRPVEANNPDNLWTLCIPCHREKTKSDWQMESRVH